MRVKTYSFEDVRKGMEVIKEQFGPDTIIVDVKHNTANGNGAAKGGCEISIALDSDPFVAMENNIGDIRKKTEAIWSDAAKYLSDRLLSIESDMLTDRLKAYPTTLKVLYDKMLRSGLDRYVALSLVSEVFAEMGSLAENSLKSVFVLKAKLGKRISLCNIISTDESIVLMGPTGSGKTEAAKKLALAIQEEKACPTIIAFDPVKRGTYAEFISFSGKTGIPFHFAANMEELESCVHNITGKKIIDITGHINHQWEAFQHLPGMKKLAVFPAGARDEAIDQYLGTMNHSSIAGLIFTKLDEYDRFGTVCNTVLRLERPIAALTGGMEVKDIVVPGSDTFGTILIEGKTW
jgi:flagellar biosynthesis GTPase FlhF